MPFIILYFIKLSVSLVVVFLFYQFVLRKLTFYNWNRWYLLGYTLLSFFIPFINISPVLDKYEMGGSESISWVPVIGNNKETLNNTLQTSATITTWQVLMLIIVGGMLILLIRLLVQYVSYCRLLKNADILSKGDINFYRIHDSIAPFSFGQSIFMNPALHTKEELEEIIKHEMVHVKQRHTIDIIWGELLCILNWVNPFAWLIRKAIRQNLEFIADRKVLEHGFDKTDYQYLLLKVVGNNRFSITHQFNFSSLKKRIAMMNKLKTARVHLVKFLFLLPVLSVVLLAFRKTQQDPVSINENSFIVAGIVFDARTNDPIEGVEMVEEFSGEKTMTDENGFYKLVRSVINEEKKVNLLCSKSGYKQDKQRQTATITNTKGKARLQFIPLKQKEDINNETVFTSSYTEWLAYKPEQKNLFALVKAKFSNYLNNVIAQQKIDQLAAKSDYPIIITDKLVCAISANNKSRAWFSKDEYNNISDIKVAVDGRIMTIEEANNSVSRKFVKGLAAIDRKSAKKLFGVDNVVLGLYINTKFDPSVFKTDTLPEKDPMEYYNEFLKNNPSIKNTAWQRDPYRIIINFKNGKKETYILDNKEEVARAEKKYGKLPVGPPPPPLPPPPPPPLPLPFFCGSNGEGVKNLENVSLVLLDGAKEEKFNLAHLSIDVRDKPFPPQMEITYKGKVMNSASQLMDISFTNIKARKIYKESGQFDKLSISLY